MTNLRLVLLPILLAALLEAGGDALIRLGLRSAAAPPRLMFFLAGAVVLFGCRWLVNAPSWDFGRLIGVYIVCFFVVAQVISWLVFHHKPSHAILIGGAFISLGGLIIAIAPPN